MLCLSRKLGERVMIGPDIVVTILEITKSNVRLGFDAPRNTLVLREELVDPDKGRDFEERVD